MFDPTRRSWRAIQAQVVHCRHEAGGMFACGKPEWSARGAKQHSKHSTVKNSPRALLEALPFWQIQVKSSPNEENQMFRSLRRRLQLSAWPKPQKPPRY